MGARGAPRRVDGDVDATPARPEPRRAPPRDGARAPDPISAMTPSAATADTASATAALIGA
jgi:hypothetical protein